MNISTVGGKRSVASAYLQSSEDETQAGGKKEQTLKSTSIKGNVGNAGNGSKVVKLSMGSPTSHWQVNRQQR